MDPGLLRGRAHLSCDSRGCKYSCCGDKREIYEGGDAAVLVIVLVAVLEVTDGCHRDENDAEINLDFEPPLPSNKHPHLPLSSALHNRTYPCPLTSDRTRNARAPTSPRSIGFCAIWESISSSSIAHNEPGELTVRAGGHAHCSFCDLETWLGKKSPLLPLSQAKHLPMPGRAIQTLRTTCLLVAGDPDSLPGDLSCFTA